MNTVSRCHILNPRKVVLGAIIGVSLASLACGWLPRAPSRVVPTSAPELAIEVVEMPQRICIGDTAIFTIRTTSGNRCDCSIGYRNVSDSWIGFNLEHTVADEKGLCRWTWSVVYDILPGKVEIRVTAERDGDSNILIQGFYVEKCAE